MATIGYPVADTVKGAWSSSLNRQASPYPGLMRGESNELFDATQWEPDWSNPLARELVAVIMPAGKPVEDGGQGGATVYVNPVHSGAGITIWGDYSCHTALSPQGLPSIRVVENSGGYLSINAVYSIFDASSGYASTVMWVGVPGAPGASSQAPLASLYVGGGTFDSCSCGLAMAADARRVRGMSSDVTAGYSYTDYAPLIPGRMNVAITSAPLDIVGTLAKPSGVATTRDLYKPNTGGTTVVNTSAYEFSVGNRGSIDGGSSSECGGFYTYAALVWRRELSAAEKVALVSDPRAIMKRRHPSKSHIFTLRNYDSALPLYTQVDDTPTCDTSDFIYTDEASSATLQLSAVDDPASSTGHALTYKARSDNGGDLVVSLQEETAPSTYTTRATRTHNNVPTDWTDYTMTLTTEEADSITDYSKLYVKLDGTP